MRTRTLIPPRPPSDEMASDDDALAGIVMRLRPALVRHARRLCRRRGQDAADDLVQDTLIYLWELGPARFTQADDKRLVSILIREMRMRAHDARLREVTDRHAALVALGVRAA